MDATAALALQAWYFCGANRNSGAGVILLRLCSAVFRRWNEKDWSSEMKRVKPAILAATVLALSGCANPGATG
ncbi:MAG: hypothetical protein LBR29_03870, partial [Methylobacteriaceae bacterium]|nr:hypothetical protein [Methylobacteriaceae bacterium]